MIWFCVLISPEPFTMTFGGTADIDFLDAFAPNVDTQAAAVEAVALRTAAAAAAFAAAVAELFGALVSCDLVEPGGRPLLGETF